MTTADSQRGRRVRFKHPVRVTTIDGEPRAWRTLSANLSRHGLFVRMPHPLDPGTRVAISLEANGQALPLAQGEVRWCRYNPSELDGRFQGCGVRFTDYLHPRAGELVEYLVDSLDTGKPLKVAPRRRRRWPIVAMLGAAAASFAAVLVFLLVPNELPPLPTPNDGAGPLAGVAVAPRTTEELAAMVSPAVDEAEPAVAVMDAPSEVTPPAPVPETNGDLVPTPPGAPVAAEATPEAVAPQHPAPLAEVPALPAAASAPIAPGKPTLLADVVAPPAGAPVAPLKPVLLAEVVAPPAPASARPASSQTPEARGAAETARREKPAAAPADGHLRLPTGAATALTWSASPEGLDVRPELRADAHVARVFTLSDPPRLVFDIEGSTPAKSHAMSSSSALITRVRLGKQGSRTRVVVDLASQPHHVTAASDHALVQF